MVQGARRGLKVRFDAVQSRENATAKAKHLKQKPRSNADCQPWNNA
jgi:hypothetical protein